MSEENTFNVLKRTPYHEMMTILQNQPSPIVPRPVIHINGIMIEQSSFYIQMMRNHHFIMILEENGWGYEEFLEEMEKVTIMNHIHAYNDSIEFPSGIIDHARKYFPNIKFTPAKIELE